MSYLQTETVTYHTQLSFRIDKARRVRQYWRIGKQEQIVPQSKVLRLFSLLFPILRVTYERFGGVPMTLPLPYPLFSPVVFPPSSMPPNLQKLQNPKG